MGKQKTAAQDALDKMEKESGAKGLSRGDAQAEIDMLTKQVANDKKYIGQLQDALDKKKSEWKVRQSLRSEEQEAISKAIAILHGDDARDLFKKIFGVTRVFVFARRRSFLGTPRRCSLRRV